MTFEIKVMYKFYHANHVFICAKIRNLDLQDGGDQLKFYRGPLLVSGA
jgi:hypothetical protein